MVATSEVFPIFVRAEYVAGQAFARFQSDAQRTAEQVKQEYRGVGQIIDQALSVERNSAGSLDLGIDELRAAAVAQEQRASAAREVADATLRAAQADGVFNSEMRQGVQAARQYATEQERLSKSLNSQVTVQNAVQRELNQTASATQEVINAQRRGTDARGSVINSVRAERTAFIQLGQQLQDVTVQAQFGTQALTIFTQQAPQAAFALTGLANSANKTKASIGAFATFLSGPWGAAIFAATAVLGPYIASLFQSGDAADESSNAHQTLAERLDITRNSYEEVLEAMREYNEESERSAQTTLQLAQASSIVANARFAEARATRESLAARLEEQIAIDPNAIDGSPTARSDAARNRAEELVRLKAALEANAVALETSSATALTAGFDLAVEQARIQGDPAAAIAEGFATARAELKGRITDTNELRKALIDLNAQEKAQLDALKQRESTNSNRGSGSNGDSEARRAAREAQRLAEFARDAASEIEAIQNRFIEIPPEVAKINNSVSALDDLIAELGERKPDNFATLIEQAQTLREELTDFGISDALDEAFDGIREDNAFQLDQQRLILAGRDEEAEVLRTLRSLQQEYGDAAADYRGEVEDIVAARRQEAEVLERIGEQIDAYRSATQSVRQELEGLFSGEGFDLQKVFNQLSARITVEQLFGDALRKLDDAVVSSFDSSADELEQNVERAGESFDTVADAAEDLAARLVAVQFNQNAPVGPQTSAGFGAEFDAAFGVPGAVAGANDNEIIVDGVAKAQKGTLSGIDPNQYSILLGEALTDPILSNLPPDIAAALSPVLSQAIGGLLTAGPVGGVLGGLNGLFGAGGSLEGALGDAVTKGLGGAFGGAQQGAQIDGLFDALGIKSSGTGAAIGGAVGSVLGPIGSLVGSIAGGLLGGAFSGQARGSAIIGGAGGSLGVTGFFGGNGEREQASGDLARTAIETVERLAAELGATLNSAAGSVSIGIRDDNLRVDTAGRGFTKLSGNPEVFDFGDDAEAAILFAVQNLIEDGVIGGLSAAEQRLIEQGNDIEQTITDVLTFRSVFDRLEGLQNPLRAEINALNNEFSELIALFERAGASAEQFAQLEQLYDLERAQLVEAATDRIAGSLKDLIDDLTTGDNGLSLRDRRESALDNFESLRSRVEAGDTTAFDDFEEAARTLLDIEREIFGSQQGYFERLEEVIDTSRQAVAEQEALVASGSGVSNPFGGGLTSEAFGIPIAQQTVELGAKLDAVNNNLGTISRAIQQTSSGGGSGGGRPVLSASFAI